MATSPSVPGDLVVSQAVHEQAVAAFLAAARVVPTYDWNRPLGPGKWSPGEIAEHLRLTYALADAELTGGKGLRIRSSFWLRKMLRLLYLPGILRSGRFPGGVMAPREVRPGAGPFDQPATLAGLEANAKAVGENLAARDAPRGPVLTHHLFGGLDVVQAWRLLTVHTEHHRRQLVAESEAVT